MLKPVQRASQPGSLRHRGPWAGLHRHTPAPSQVLPAAPEDQGAPRWLWNNCSTEAGGASSGHSAFLKLPEVGDSDWGPCQRAQEGHSAGGVLVPQARGKLGRLASPGGAHSLPRFRTMSRPFQPSGPGVCPRACAPAPRSLARSCSRPRGAGRPAQRGLPAGWGLALSVSVYPWGTGWGTHAKRSCEPCFSRGLESAGVSQAVAACPFRGESRRPGESGEMRPREQTH